MRAFAFVLAASLAAAPAAQAAAPKRVASLNLCTDELLLLLGEERQIASVTHLSQNPAETPLWRQARRYGRNDGSLASVAALRPDLVLTMGGGARDRAGIAGRLGIRLLDLPYPRSLSDIAANAAAVAGALGRPGAAKPALRLLQQLEQSAPAAGTDTIWLGGGGRTVAASGLSAQWMRLAGLRQRALTGDRVSLEELLVRPPALILRSDYRAGQYSSEQRWLSHPLAAHVRRSRTLATDGRLWTCMGPLLAPEILRLRREVRG
ncbi:MAG: transporter substrate-binding protein [Alphaproteobacteria bacterium]|nr:transporter substrate-binding protein [Alphaproteobacteria bacterium]